MDIHRCRFVPFPPSTINALAFTHSHISKDQKTAPPRLAVGRANGDIEIWNPLRGSWLQETIIHGGKDRSIDGLVWTQDPNEEVNGKAFIGKSRLFSVGYTTTVTEWDLRTGRPLRNASGNHGEIWCIAAQPSATGATSGTWEGQSLIAGCTDGALVLYTTKDDDLQLQRILVRPSAKKAKIISITFQNRNIVVAGCTDSVIRIYDIRTGTLLRSMTLGSGPKGGPKEIIIWCVKVLKDGTIVSGDSTGELKIWDGITYTLRQRIKSHEQDVLSLAASADGSAIFSGGMDRRTVTYKPEGKGKPRWAEVTHRRFHNHDVKAMASFEGNGMSVVVSGGPDASPIITPLGQFGFENQRSLPFLPQELAIGSSPRRRLVLGWWEREVHIWRVNKTAIPSSDDDEEKPAAKGRKLVAKILIKGEANITSATLTADGSLLAVSTTAEIKVFQLRSRTDEDSLKVSKVTLPEFFSSGARLIQFSPDGKWLSIVRPDSHILLSRISIDTSTSSTIFHVPISKLSRLDRNIDKFALLGGLGTYDRTVTQIAWSSDSKILAVSDLSGYIDSFVLSGIEDTTQAPLATTSAASSTDSDSDSDSDDDSDSSSTPRLIFGQHWTRNPSASLLPKLPTAPVVLSFRPATQKQPTNGIAPHPTRNNPHPVSHDLPSGEARLLVVTATSDVYEFDVLKGGLSPWSRRNPPQAFPGSYRKTLDQAKGCVWDISEGKERVWLFGVGWLWMFDLARDFAGVAAVEGSDDEDELEHEQVGGSKKRRRRHGKENPSGAGGMIADEALSTGMSRKIRKVTQENEDKAVEDEMELVPVLEEDKDVEKESPNHWHTFKYRPILGVVVVGEGEQGCGPEVAVVERPIWETSLPPRFYGEQEWRDKNSVD
ncbi:WD40-repeat-containing domain protein [Rhexocercosporidium sp. MPI-PUGE-AT-0058]|nr:WD40-repeat-containing domain protein [Rhexocercosporidium sp. MPI-PUGE-AT-0058]